MVVIEEGQKVNYSSSYQWASLPGSLTANRLQRDLAKGSLFTQVVGSGSPLAPPLELTGHVFAFEWKWSEAGYRAHLDVEINLSDATDTGKAILQKEYPLWSEPYPINKAENFEAAMSSVMEAFSKQFQEDLCNIAKSLKN